MNKGIKLVKTMMDMAEHPQRQALIDELHARPFFDFEGEGGVHPFIYLVAALIPLLFPY